MVEIPTFSVGDRVRCIDATNSAAWGINATYASLLEQAGGGTAATTGHAGEGALLTVEFDNGGRRQRHMFARRFELVEDQPTPEFEVGQPVRVTDVEGYHYLQRGSIAVVTLASEGSLQVKGVPERESVRDLYDDGLFVQFVHPEHIEALDI